VHDGTFVLFGTHHDVHFHAADDDSSCVADNLAIAKAMLMSGYRPQHTVRFMITTGEEFGYTNSWYDWSIGAWWSITHTHPIGWARSASSSTATTSPGRRRWRGHDPGDDHASQQRGGG